MVTIITHHAGLIELLIFHFIIHHTGLVATCHTGFAEKFQFCKAITSKIILI